jgi:dTDP-4-amino-4,6-dideoxygalactose transaminase
MPQRERVRGWLAERGIATGIHYPTPIHQLAPYQHLADGSLPVVEQAATEVLSLPMFPHMTQEQVGRVCRAVQIADELMLTPEAIHA